MRIVRVTDAGTLDYLDGKLAHPLGGDPQEFKETVKEMVRKVPLGTFVGVMYEYPKDAKDPNFISFVIAFAHPARAWVDVLQMWPEKPRLELVEHLTEWVESLGRESIRVEILAGKDQKIPGLNLQPFSTTYQISLGAPDGIPTGFTRDGEAEGGLDPQRQPGTDQPGVDPATAGTGGNGRAVGAAGPGVSGPDSAGAGPGV